MISVHWTVVRAFIALLALTSGIVSAATEVSSGAGRVVSDGDFVRIESNGTRATIDGDWRSQGERDGDTEVLLKQIGASVNSDHIRLQLASDVLFEFGSDAVTAAAAERLTQIAQVIRERAVGEVLVIGHTDAIGDHPSNQRLSERRAINVMRWLNSHAAIPSGLMVGRGMGEVQPLVAEKTRHGADDPAGRARNRRVEFFIGTSDQVDLRSVAEAIEVYTDQAEDAVEQANAIVGGLDAEIAAAMAMGGAQAGAVSASSSCAAGRFCEASCPEGDCHLICPAGAKCNFACSGGNCQMDCAAGGICEFSCSGGNCRYACAAGSTCDTSCSGGGCSGG